MNKGFISRVAATALFATVIPMSERVYAQASHTVDDKAFGVAATEAVLETPSTNPLQQSLRSTTTVRVNAHARDDRQAATVYVSNIPVLTYIDTEASTAGDVVSGWLPLETSGATDNGDVITDATEMAVKLKRFSNSAADFTAHWDDGNYLVMAGDSPLVALGDTVQLPDATDNEAENVLQVTNRLRRLLGDGATEPVTEVIGRPAPAQQVAAVRSSYSGMASWYGPGFHGRRSASGESFNQYAMTAAHRTLPFGTEVLVTNLNNGRQVVVRINDRGPYSHGRIIDLSAGAANAIGLQAAGVGPVKIEVLQ